MKNKIFTITIIANIFFYLIIFSYEEKYLSSQSVDQLNEISIEEYNMSILTIDSNKKLISVITAIKLNNMNEEPFVPNFDVSKNNKMDFLEAEGVMDLINAETKSQKSLAIQQVDGTLSMVFKKWNDVILKLLAHYEGQIDFPEDEVPKDTDKDVINQIIELTKEIEFFFNLYLINNY